VSPRAGLNPEEKRKSLALARNRTLTIQPVDIMTAPSRFLTKVVLPHVELHVFLLYCKLIKIPFEHIVTYNMGVNGRKLDLGCRTS
jgi:hypothetical protein